MKTKRSDYCLVELNNDVLKLAFDMNKVVSANLENFEVFALGKDRWKSSQLK